MNNYKKIVLTLLVAILGIGAANAQLRFGVKAGLNLNSLHFNKSWQDNLKSDNHAGFTAGVMTEFQVPVIGLCFDLSAMYTRMNADIATSDGKAELPKNFIEVPINIKYKIGLPVVSNFLTPFIFTGPAFDFRLGKGKHEVDTKGTQVVWNLGIGVELIHHLQIQGGYGFGVNNIAKHVKSDVDYAKIRNNYWTITAAWLF